MTFNHLVVRKETIWHQVLILHHLMIKVQPLSPMRQILENRLLAYFQFLSFLLYSCPLVFITLTHHGEMLLYVLDGLFDFRFLGEQILLCVAISDDVGALIIDYRQHRFQLFKSLAVLFQQFYIHALP